MKLPLLTFLFTNLNYVKEFQFDEWKLHISPKLLLSNLFSDPHIVQYTLKCYHITQNFTSKCKENHMIYVLQIILQARNNKYAL